MARETLSRVEELADLILTDLYAQEIVPLEHPAIVRYSPDQVKKTVLRHLNGRCLSITEEQKETV